MENTGMGFWNKVEVTAALLKDLKVGDEFYEVAYGLAVGYKVLTGPVEGEGHEGRKTWSLTAGNEYGDVVEFTQTEGLEHLSSDYYKKKGGDK